MVGEWVGDWVVRRASGGRAAESERCNGYGFSGGGCGFSAWLKTVTWHANSSKSVYKQRKPTKTNGKAREILTVQWA